MQNNDICLFELSENKMLDVSIIFIEYLFISGIVVFIDHLFISGIVVFLTS